MVLSYCSAKVYKIVAETSAWSKNTYSFTIQRLSPGDNRCPQSNQVQVPRQPAAGSWLSFVWPSVLPHSIGVGFRCAKFLKPQAPFPAGPLRGTVRLRPCPCLLPGLLFRSTSEKDQLLSVQLFRGRPAAPNKGAPAYSMHF